ncbi:unnamed protein product [Prorocentrum cordatum]|uniref:Peptidylprolyl isomerase n=1 Tax=Prorocentrum cordatum TaxID=2364126 RepID=A0ABN9YAX0_9DINO|nr:unnamed protein product [Polarella glacialis]
MRASLARRCGGCTPSGMRCSRRQPRAAAAPPRCQTAWPSAPVRSAGTGARSARRIGKSRTDSFIGTVADVWDKIAQERVRLHESETQGVSLAVGSNCHERAAQVKHVIVRDLPKAGTALRMSLDHLDLPCALYALYEGHRGAAGGGNTCSDFCAKHLHGKLLPKLAAFRGQWLDEHLKVALRETFEELDASFAEKNPDAKDGCCAAVALVIGDRVAVASLGDIACLACLRSGEIVRLAKAHAVPDPDADEDDEDSNSGEAAAAAAEAPPSADFRWTRSFGDLSFKAPGREGPRVTATPDVAVLRLEKEHLGFILVCRELYAAIGGETAVSTVFRRSAGRPRMASGALVDAAVQWLGDVKPSSGLASVVAFVDWQGAAAAGGSSASSEPAAKRQRKEPEQVRLRNILLKHRDCRSAIDKVRNKQVKRPRCEAERMARRIFEECVTDTSRKVFTQRCRELSECQSSLKAREMAGDLGWVKRTETKFGEAFHAVAFSLQINELSDLVDTDQGIHLLLRTA